MRYSWLALVSVGVLATVVQAVMWADERDANSDKRPPRDRDRPHHRAVGDDDHQRGPDDRQGERPRDRKREGHRDGDRPRGRHGRPEFGPGPHGRPHAGHHGGFGHRPDRRSGAHRRPAGPPWMQGRRGGNGPFARGKGGRGFGPPRHMQGGHGPGHHPGGHPGMQGAGPRPEEIFNRLDADGDGEITKEEFFQHHAQIDADGDGVISREEFADHLPGAHRPDAAGRDRERPRDGHRRPPRTAEADNEKPDTEGRRPQRPEDREFGDPRPERQGPAGRGPGRPGFGPEGFGGRGPQGGPPPADVVFERFDGNRDGKLTKDEAPEFVWERLSHADADGDGAVTKSEFENHTQQVRESGRPAQPKPEAVAEPKETEQPEAKSESADKPEPKQDGEPNSEPEA